MTWKDAMILAVCAVVIVSAILTPLGLLAWVTGWPHISASCTIN